jgi:hypothetical protein
MSRRHDHRRPARRAVAGAAIAQALRASERARHSRHDPRLGGLREDPDRHVAAFQPYKDAGFDEIYVANMAPRYRQFFRLNTDEILPRLRG